MTNRLLRNSMVFASSRNLLLGLSFVRNLFVARSLGSTDYGMWVVISLFLLYGDQIHLGLRHAGDKEIPFLIGRGDQEGATCAANTLYGGILALSLLGFVILSGFSPWIQNSSATSWYLFPAIGLIILTDQVAKFYLMYLRAHQEFVFSSKAETFFEVLRTILVCLLVAWFNLGGAVIAFLLASLATATFFSMRYRHEVHPSLDVAALKGLWKSGAVLFFAGLSYITILSIDRVVASFILPRDVLGFYGIAALISQLPISSAQAVSSVMYPIIAAKIGEGVSKQDLFAFFMSILSPVAYLLPVLTVGVAFGAEFGIRLFLPGYLGAVPILMILSVGANFLSLVPLPMGMLLASGNGRAFLGISFLTCVISLCFFLFVFFFHSFQNAVSIAVGSISTAIVFLCLAMMATFRASGTPKKDRVPTLGLTLGPLGYGSLAFAAVWQFVPPNYFGLMVSIFIRYVSFVLLYAPFLWFANRRFSLLKNLRKMVTPNVA